MEKTPHQNRPEHGNGVVRPDFFPFFVSTSVIADRHLVQRFGLDDGPAEDFRMLLPAFRYKDFRVNQIAAVEQIARINVCKGGVVENIKN